MNTKIIASVITALAGLLSAATLQAQNADSTVAEGTSAPIETALEESAGENTTPAVANITEAADSAYSADNFELARALYEQAIAEEGTSSVLFYNLGNTYYRQGNLGKALVNYERALKLDPTNGDARTNLEFVKSKITDRQIDEGSIMTRVWDSIVCAFKADTWACITIILFALFLAGAVTYLFSSVIIVRKLSFFGGAVIFLLCVGGIIISFAAANRVESHNEAIILQPASQLSTSPREARTQQEEAFLLHEGTKVEIVDSVSTPGEGKWYEVLVGGRERAWIKAADVERI